MEGKDKMAEMQNGAEMVGNRKGIPRRFEGITLIVKFRVGFPEKVVFLKRGKPRQRFQLGFGETVCFHREIPPLADFITSLL